MCIYIFAVYTQNTQVQIKSASNPQFMMGQGEKTCLIDHNFEINWTGAIAFAAMVDDIFAPGDAFDVDDAVFGWIFEFHRDQWTEVASNISERIEMAGDAARTH